MAFKSGFKVGLHNVKRQNFKVYFVLGFDSHTHLLLVVGVTALCFNTFYQSNRRFYPKEISYTRFSFPGFKYF